MLTIIKGYPGSGKNLLLTIIAYETLIGNIFKNKTEIHSNFTLTFPKINKFNRIPILPLEFEFLFSEENINALLLIDEIYLYIEARLSQTSDNIGWSYILFQQRKKDVSIFGTLQIYKTIDVRFREMVDRIVTCKKLKKKQKFVYRFYDIKKKKYLGKREVSFSEAKYYFNFFNTYETIKNKRINNFRYKNLNVEKLDNLIENNIQDFYEFIANYEYQKTLKIIKFYCRDRKLPISKDFIDAFQLSLQKYEKNKEKERNKNEL